jgi:hypothetical protein
MRIRGMLMALLSQPQLPQARGVLSRDHLGGCGGLEVVGAARHVCCRLPEYQCVGWWQVEVLVEVLESCCAAAQRSVR